ncbi:hypothetical protein QR680_017276 [Steinernema hermaphroditum]|uniref:Impact N-terminal domain-containing protein n=1 Tax=Steinernema hermaphroditum TaxID=289476 RepID=A0AA39HDZ1_9BILA|nr:hypothetical protein QR680_017276 [Steinernema hermaphroditum]
MREKMEEEDRQARLDELMAVESIYGDLVRLESERQVTVKFSERVEIAFELPVDYPSKFATYVENIGAPVLFAWIAAVLEHLEHMKDAEEDEEAESNETPEGEVAVPEWLNFALPEIVSSDTVTDRKSVFQAHAARIYSKEEAMAVLDKLKENTKISRATHNIYAWIVRRPADTAGKPDYKAHDCDDDGETGAASKVLGMMFTMGAENLIVVVSRWYGGIHLGPDRFRHINNIARSVIVENALVEKTKERR